MLNKILIVVLVSIFLYDTSLHAKLAKVKDGIETLMKYDKEQKNLKKITKQDTINYEKALSVIKKGEIKIGSSVDLVLKKIGEPVVILYDQNNNTEEFIYKPADSDFFATREAHLMFDSNGKVIDFVLPSE